jgi:hypothetical protein
MRVMAGSQPGTAVSRAGFGYAAIWVKASRVRAVSAAPAYAI